MADAYGVLGIERSATDEEIDEVYKAHCLRLEDLVKTDRNAAIELDGIRFAYAHLGNPDRRARYDRIHQPAVERLAAAASVVDQRLQEKYDGVEARRKRWEGQRETARRDIAANPVETPTAASQSPQTSGKQVERPFQSEDPAERRSRWERERSVAKAAIEANPPLSATEPAQLGDPEVQAAPVAPEEVPEEAGDVAAVVEDQQVWKDSTTGNVEVVPGGGLQLIGTHTGDVELRGGTLVVSGVLIGTVRAVNSTVVVDGRLRGDVYADASSQVQIGERRQNGTVHRV